MPVEPAVRAPRLVALVLLALLVPPAVAVPPEGLSGRMVLDGEQRNAPQRAKCEQRVVLAVQDGGRTRDEIQREALWRLARTFLPPGLADRLGPPKSVRVHGGVGQ
jgi:hypothetical protein